MPRLSGRALGPLSIAAIYTGLIVIMMIFYVALTLISGSAHYPVPWLPDVTRGIFDVIKILVGAVIGALTPRVLEQIGTGRDG